MSVTIVKPKVQDVSDIESEELVTAELVDEFGSLSAKLAKKLAKLGPLQKKVAGLEKGIIAAVDEVLAANQKITLTGEDYELQLGPQGLRTSIKNMEHAVDMLGEELFLKLAKITMKDLQAYLTPEQLAEVTVQEYKNKRRVKIEEV